jgi:hypothetical protein
MPLADMFAAYTETPAQKAERAMAHRKRIGKKRFRQNAAADFSPEFLEELTITAEDIDNVAGTFTFEGQQHTLQLRGSVWYLDGSQLVFARSGPQRSFAALQAAISAPATGGQSTPSQPAPAPTPAPATTRLEGENA